MDFEGYAIGGTSVGESKETLYRMIDYSMIDLPKDKVKYLMGVGSSDALLEGILKGVDILIAFCLLGLPDMEQASQESQY